MRDAQFWDPTLYYLIWFAILANSIGLAANIQFWEVVIGGFKIKLASIIKWLAALSALYNIVLFILDYNQLITGYWLWVNRALSLVAPLTVLTFVMTYINYRSYMADDIGRKNIADGYRKIEREMQLNKRERESANAVNNKFENIHGSN